MFDFNNEKERKIQKFLLKFSQQNKFEPKNNIISTELGQTEQEERRQFVTKQILGDRTFTSFWNLTYFQSVKDLINKYRQIEFVPEVHDAVSQIVDECVSLQSEQPVRLDLSRTKYFAVDKDLQNKLYIEFQYILDLLGFYERADELFKQFYIDGRLFFENIYDASNLKAGIQGLTLLNPKNIEIFYDEDEKTYFNYINQLEGSATNFANQNFKQVLYTEDNLTYAHSGMWDYKKEVILGFLHPALKDAMRLSLLEDAAVVYRLVRAPERRIYQIDTGKLPPKQAEEYVQRLMEKFKTRKLYDPETGQLVSKQAFMNMLEDIWLPKSEGKGTEVSTLEGGKNLDEIEDIQYFQKKLYKSLKIPRKRIDPEDTYTYISDSEINYEEYQFLKYIQKIRQRFSAVFYDLLKKNIVLKGIMDVKNFERLQISFIWETDSKFDEVNGLEMLDKRINMLDSLNDYIGKFYSKKWVRKNVLKMTDQEIDEMDVDIEKERKEMEKIGINVDEPETSSIF